MQRSVKWVLESEINVHSDLHNKCYSDRKSEKNRWHKHNMLNFLPAAMPVLFIVVGMWPVLSLLPGYVQLIMLTFANWHYLLRSTYTYTCIFDSPSNVCTYKFENVQLKSFSPLFHDVLYPTKFWKNYISHAFSAIKTDLVLIWHIGVTTNNQIPSYGTIAYKCTCRIFRRVNKFPKLYRRQVTS